METTKTTYDQPAKVYDQIKLVTQEKKRAKDRDPDLAKKYPDRYVFTGKELNSLADEYSRVAIQNTKEGELDTMKITVGEGDKKKTIEVKVAQRIWAVDKSAEDKSGKCFIVTDSGDIISMDATPGEPPKNEHDTNLWKLSGAQLLHAEGFVLSDTAKKLSGQEFVMMSQLNKDLHASRDYEELQDILAKLGNTASSQGSQTR